MAGEATAPFATGGWVRERDTIPVQVTGRSFAGSFVPRASGEYRLALETVTGVPLAGDTVRLPVRVVPDSAPAVLVPVPGADTVAPLGMRLPLVVDAEDDHGLSAVDREPAGEPPRPARFGPAPGGAAPRRHAGPWLLTVDFDFAARGRPPSGRYAATMSSARDNAPAARTGRSTEYVLRLPSLSEVRAAERAGDRRGGEPDGLALGEQQAARAADRGSVARGGAPTAESRMAARRSRCRSSRQKAQAVAQSQEQVLRQAEELRDVMDELQQSGGGRGAQDPACQRRLQEIRDSWTGRSRRRCGSGWRSCGRR